MEATVEHDGLDVILLDGARQPLECGVGVALDSLAGRQQQREIELSLGVAGFGLDSEGLSSGAEVALLERLQPLLYARLSRHRGQTDHDARCDTCPHP